MLASLASVEALLALAQPWPLKLAVDNAIEMRPFPSWLHALDGLNVAGRSAVAIGASIAIVGLAGAASFALSVAATRTSEAIAMDLRCGVIRNLVDPGLRTGSTLPAGEVVNRLTSDVARVEDTITSLATVVAPEVLTLVGIVVVMTTVDGVFAATSLLVVPVLWLLTVRRRRAVRDAEYLSRAAAGRLATRTVRVVDQARVTQLFCQQERVVQRFRREAERARDARLSAAIVDARFRPVGDLLVTMVGGACLAVGLMRVRSGSMTVGTLLVVLAYMSRIFGPVRALSSLATSLAKSTASRARLAELLIDSAARRDRRLALGPEAPSIALENVSYSYDGSVDVLSGIDVAFPAGTFSVIVGPSGAGKSTLCALLTGVDDPTSGRVLVNDQDLLTCDLASVRANLAVVPQDSSLLDGTIVDNIAFGRVDAAFHEVRDVARSCGVESLAANLADGLDTVLGDRGEGLSGGEQRRVALARAMVRNAPILVLDEPLSGLDSMTAASMLRDLRALTSGRTVIAVSHHLPLAMQADQVIVLTAGKVAEFGPPLELLESDGPFSKLWASAHEHLPEGEWNHEQAVGMLGSVRREWRLGPLREVEEVA